MKAVLFYAPGDIRLDELKWTKARPGEVLVEITIVKLLSYLKSSDQVEGEERIWA